MMNEKNTLEEPFRNLGPILFKENNVSPSFMQIWLAKSLFFQKGSEIKVKDLFDKYSSDVEFIQKKFPFYSLTKANQRQFSKMLESIVEDQAVNYVTSYGNPVSPRLVEKEKARQDFFVRKANGKYVRHVLWNPLAFSSESSFQLANEEKKKEILSDLKNIKAEEVFQALADKYIQEVSPS
jgi:hypothetical protein